MNPAQITIIVLIAMSSGMAIVEHGKPKTGKHSFWVTTISNLITVSILWWGGFWN